MRTYVMAQRKGHQLISDFVTPLPRNASATSSMGEEVPDWSWKWGAKVRNPIDMPDDMLKSAIDISIKELEAMKSKVDATKTGVDPLEVMGMEVAQNVKVALDSLWTPHWHVTIGRNFGSFVTHEMRMFVYFYYDGIVRGVSLPWHHAVKDREYLSAYI